MISTCFSTQQTGVYISNSLFSSSSFFFQERRIVFPTLLDSLHLCMLGVLKLNICVKCFKEVSGVLTAATGASIHLCFASS